jgi:hypothetical protein
MVQNSSPPNFKNFFSYGIRSKLTTVKNPQANRILKRTHQVIGNLLRSSRLITQDLDTVSTQQELLMPVMWAINTTFHTTLKASPAQLAFSRDMILPTSFTANWYAINSRKQAQSQSAADVVTKRYKYLRALIDSGSSSSIICESSMPDPTKKKIKDDPSGETKWTTKGGTFITTGEANIWFQLTEFAPSRLFKHIFLMLPMVTLLTLLMAVIAKRKKMCYSQR